MINEPNKRQTFSVYSRVPCGRAILLLGLVVVSRAQFCQAQPPQPDVAEAQASEARKPAEQRLPIDRKVIQLMESLRSHIENRDFNRAFDDLRALQTADPNSLVPSRSPKVYVPLYRAVFGVVYQLPDSERRRFAETRETTAQRLLNLAILDGELSSIPEVVLKGAGTQSALDSHWVVARMHLAKANFHAARCWLMPLTEGRVPEKDRVPAQQILGSLEEGLRPPAPPSIPTDEVQIPGHVVWQTRSTLSPRLRKQVKVFLQSAHLEGVVPQSVWDEVVDEGRIFRRSLRGLAAVDSTTGETIWEYPTTQSLDAKIAQSSNSQAALARARIPGGSGSGFQALDLSPCASAFCRDNSLGRLTSDSDYVYLVSGQNDYQEALRAVGRFLPFSRNLRKESSRLIAIEKRTGRRVWTLGEATIEGKLGQSTSSAWIAGPPLTTERSLYCVFEWDGEISLGCVERRTGELLWSTVLAFPEQTIDKDPVRAMWGCTPVRSGGLIWSPTTTGWTACVDEVAQSVVFVSDIQANREVESQIRIGRNQPVVFTRSKSLKDRWSVARLVPSGSRLAILSQESRSIVFMDAVTGEQHETLDVESGEILLHADDSLLVLSTRERIRAVTSHSGQPQWQLELDEAEGYPVGQAAKHGDNLTMLMSSGRMAQLSLKTGDIRSQSSSLLPINAWGRLVHAPGEEEDLLFLAADRVSRVSATPSATPAGDPLEIAASLLSSGNWEAVLKAGNEIIQQGGVTAEVESMMFTARLQLAARDSEGELQALRDSSLTNQQSIQVQILELCIAKERGQLPEVAQRLSDLLSLPIGLLRQPAPGIADLWESEIAEVEFDTDANRGAPRPSLLTWLVTRVNQMFRDPIAAGELEKRLQKCSDLVLCRIEQPFALPLLRSRLENASSPDTFLRLMHASLRLQSTLDASDAEREQEIVSQRFRQLAGEDGSTEVPARLLFASVLAEYGAVFHQVIAAESSELLDSDSTLNARLENQAKLWDRTTYSAIPVNRAAPFTRGASFRAFPVESDDPFLGHFYWAIVRGTPGRLLSVSLADSSAKWSIPGSFDSQGSYSEWTDQLFRAGSVILLRTSKSLTAVSVFDNRILWKRVSTGQSKSTGFGAGTNFTAFDSTQVRLPSQRSGSFCEIVGLGPSWICLKEGRRLEVIDPLNGAQYWSVELPDAKQRAVASDKVVFIENPNRTTSAFDTMTGQPVETANDDKVVRNTIRGVGSDLVVWKHAKPAQPAQLCWIDALTGSFGKSVSLEGLEHFHLIDDRSLAGFSSDRGIAVFDLINGEVNRYSIAGALSNTNPGDPIADPDSGATRPEGAVATELWTSERLHVVADPLNYYVTNHQESWQPPFRQPYGRNSLLVVGGLRVVSRSTGNVTLAIDSSRRRIAATDQPELGALVLIDENRNTRVGKEPIATSVAMYSKTSGQVLFQQVIPSFYGSLFIRFQSPRPNVLDVFVQGMTIRLQGESVP